MSRNNENPKEMREEEDLEAGNLNRASSSTASEASLGPTKKHMDASRSMVDIDQGGAQEAGDQHKSSFVSPSILQERVNQTRLDGELQESRLSDHASSYLPFSLRGTTKTPPFNHGRDSEGYSADTSEQGESDIDGEAQSKQEEESDDKPFMDKSRWDSVGRKTPDNRWNPHSWFQDPAGSLKPPPHSSDHGYHGEDEDDGSVSSLETEDGLIAIGIPEPTTTRDQDQVDPEVAAPKTKEEAKQHALDKVVAENIAEEEHNVKAAAGLKKSPPNATAIRRSSIRDDRSVDEMMEAKRLERERSRDTTLDMYARRLQRTAARQAASVEDTKMHQPSSGGRVSLPLRSKSHDSTDSSDSGFSFASARVRATLRSREEAIKLKEQESGPSLASATSDQFIPGAFPVMQQDRHEKEAGPSLAPAFASEMDTNGPCLAPAVAESTIDQEEEEEEIEAQAGIPVVLPGAFAIEGMDANSSGSLGFDSAVEMNSLDSVEEEQIEDTVVVPQAQLSSTQAPAFEAELHEEVVVDGAVLQIEDEEDDPKVVKRLRMIQVAVLCFSVAAVALVVASVVSFSGRDKSRSTEPTIEGWVQVGSDILGLTEEKQGFFGKNLDLSGDGTLLAVSAPGVDDESKLDIGQIYIFKEGLGVNGTTEWLRQDVVDGIGSSREAKASISLSQDGSHLAVGYPLYEGGYVQLFEDDGNGMQLAETLISFHNVGTNSDFGYSVDLNFDGSVLAIGAPKMSTDDLEGTGVVHVYRALNSSWAPLGEDIVGEEFEFIGWSTAVAMRDGESVRIATGGPVHEIDKGIVRVFDWAGFSWQQIGGNLAGEESFDRFGESVAFSGDGSVLAVGARGTLGPGKAYIFREKGGQWVRDDALFLGEEDGEGFGASVSLSSDGAVLAVGGSKNSEFGEGSGHIQVWKYSNLTASWEQEGSSIGGSEGNGFGSSVSLSADGSRVAGGAPLAEFDGSVPNNGVARVYERIVD